MDDAKEKRISTQPARRCTARGIPRLLLAALLTTLTLGTVGALLTHARGFRRARSDVLCVNPGGTAGCYARIQEALGAAHDGDTIRVSLGTYSETLVITKSLLLQGGWNATFRVQNRATAATIINARRQGPVIQVSGAASPTVELFTVTGGDATAFGGHGGGVRIVDAGLVTLRYNTLLDNVACLTTTCQGQGGGIAVYSATARIEHNTVVSNLAQAGATGGGAGGGIYIGQAVSATVAHNAILSNTATLTGAGQGGGLYASGPVNLTDNQLRGNVASVTGDGSGGGLYGSQLRIAQGNTVERNVATRGGGIFIDAGDSPQRLYDNLVARNRATGTGLPEDQGGGGIASQASQAVITGNQILSNTAAHTGGGLLIFGGSDYLVRENVLQNNTANFGGGLFVYSSTGTLAQNWIRNNVAITRGGGLYLFRDATATVDANRILSNSVLTGEGGGICIRNDHDPLTLTNQIIAHNSAQRDGGGLYAFNSRATRAINNTLVENDRGTAPEGVAVMQNVQITLVNNIVVGHGVAVTVTTSSTATLSHNDYWDNGVDVVGQFSGLTDLKLQPQFVDRVGRDYHLRPSSPLIDAGDDRFPVPYDFEGDPRPPEGGVDVGADEVIFRLFLPLTMRGVP